MDAYLKVENKLVTCPYDEAHKVKESRLQLHIAKCKLNHLEKIKEVCPFNATHVIELHERDYHLLNCPDKAPLDRKLAQSLDKNNPFKGRTAAPPFSEAVVPEFAEENWDEEISGSNFIPQNPPPPGAIIEPRAMSKPAERRQLYKELHRMQTEPEKDKDSSQPVKLPSIPRQPKEPSETQKFHAVQQQQQNLQAIQTLGLGRGKPTPRIAAKIFDKPENTNSWAQMANVSGVTNGISNLGLSRGQGTSQGVAPLFDDQDFPALGCGRGAFRTPKQNPRNPGTKPQNA